MTGRSVRAFTLVELLVVIAIIAVLLALLTPALDKAIYQAEFAVCAANQRSIGTNVLGYAYDNKRKYPVRPGVMVTSGTNTTIGVSAVWRPNALKGDGRAVTNFLDDRPAFKKFMSLKSLVCPLSGKFDIDAPETYQRDDCVFANYNLWFGWRWLPTLSGMFKIGDRWEWNDDKFNILVSDRDEYDVASPGYSDTSHPDEDRILNNRIYQGFKATGANAAVTAGTNFWASSWVVGGTYKRGKMDMNFLFQDLSVICERRLAWDDQRLAEVPLWARVNGDTTHGIRVLKPQD
jgi:prepilin-type N-terminal cleavage/methylation domain-containing protein